MSRNPARSRPLSRNVKRLMWMARESPPNGDVEKVRREFDMRDLAYCDMQGSIFMAAVDRGFAMDEFAPVYMNSQLAGVMDYSFSVAGGMEEDDISNYLRIPLLLKSPSVIVDTVMWLDRIAKGIEPGESMSLAIVKALNNEEVHPEVREIGDVNADELADEYEYAYWLGYIYRCECLLHDESSRMVYGAFAEETMRGFYEKMDGSDDAALSECAPEICRRLDTLLIGKLWKEGKRDEKSKNDAEGKKGNDCQAPGG